MDTLMKIYLKNHTLF